MLPLLVASAIIGTPLSYELEAYESAADPAAVLVSGKARFTVLSSRLLRMEYAESGKFEDRPTIAFVARKQVVPKFTWNAKAGTLSTKDLVLTYTGGAFTPTSLKVAPVKGASTAFTGWAFGQTSDNDPGNLRGTIRTLDQKVNVSLDCATFPSSDHCTWGLVSRTGWSLVNETGVPCMGADDWWADADGKMLRNVDTHDLYLFAHGHDYMGALADYKAVGGRVPILPRRNLGLWFTRWYDYDAADVRSIVADFEERQLPLDVLVLDMNWHLKNDWTGYTFDPTLFAEPTDVFEWLHNKGLSVAANLHDANGINPWEAKHAAAASAMGLPPSAGTLKLNLTSKSYVFALEDIVLGAVEAQGMGASPGFE